MLAVGEQVWRLWRPRHAVWAGGGGGPRPRRHHAPTVRARARWVDSARAARPVQPPPAPPHPARPLHPQRPCAPRRRLPVGIKVDAECGRRRDERAKLGLGAHVPGHRGLGVGGGPGRGLGVVGRTGWLGGLWMCARVGQRRRSHAGPALGAQPPRHAGPRSPPPLGARRPAHGRPRAGAHGRYARGPAPCQARHRCARARAARAGMIDSLVWVGVLQG